MQDLSFKNILVGLDGSEFSKNAFEVLFSTLKLYYLVNNILVI